MIRKAKLSDVNAIKSLLDYYADKGLLLPRSIADIVSLIRDFSVFEEKGKVLGCVALHLCWLDLGEIRSLAVEESRQGKGIGGKLLKNALREAKQLYLKKVFTLTYKPEFFETVGFKRVSKSKLPHKIWADCLNCPKFPNCDEIALAIELH